MSGLVYFAGGIAALSLARRIRPFSRAAAIVLLLLPLLITGRALLTGGVFGPVDLAYSSEPLASVASQAGVGAVANPSISDVYAEFMPWNDALRRSISHGRWPLWNPYELCGTPLAGAAQSSPYHPITLIGLLVPLRQYFALAAALMLLSAAGSAFLLFREFMESEIAALFGAAAWMCSTHLLFFAGTALVLAVSVTPLVLLGARSIVRAPGRRSVTILAAALLLVVMAGHPESALHVIALGIAYFLFELAGAGRGAPLKRILVSGFAAGGIALLLSAIFLLPVFEVIRQSEEYVYRAVGYRHLSSTGPQMVHRLSANVFPFLEGASGVEEQHHPSELRHGWLATSYAGSILFAPALLALWRSRSRERWFFLGAAVFGLGAGISAPGITELLSHLPGFSIAVNDRMIAFAALGICALAALGLDACDRKLAIVLAAIAGVIVIAAVTIPSGVSADYLRVNGARSVLPLLLGACAMVVLPKQRALFVLFTLLLIQRAGETASLQPTLPSRSFYPPFPGLAVMRADEPFRIVGLGAMLPPELSTHYGLEDIRGFAATTFARLDATYRLWSVRQPVWSNRVNRLDSPLLSMMNTRFAIVPRGVSLPARWRLRAQYAAYAIAENEGVLPRAFVPQAVEIAIEPADSLRAIEKISDFAAQSVIESRLANDWAPNGPGRVTIRSDRSGYLLLHARMDGPGWVVISNARWRGWRARSGGRPLALHYANHAFMAVYLPQGEHNVKLVYRPRSFITGAWISGVTLLLLLAYAFIPSSAITFFMSFQTSFFADGVRRRYAG